MKKRILGVLVFLVLVAVAGAAYVFFSFTPDLSVYESLRDPRITTLSDQRVIQVTVPDKAKEAAGTGIGLLTQTWFKLGLDQRYPPAPRGRWPAGLDTPEDQWTGIFGMPIPDTVQALKDPPTKEGLTPEIATWSYGETAEILHVGGYDAEKPTVQRLHDYITAQGYEIAGLHEEEYLKGPGMFFAGDPAGYYTIIRYPVQKRAPQEIP